MTNDRGGTVVMERTGTLGRPKLRSLLHSDPTMLSSNKFDGDNYNTNNNQSQNSNDNLEYSRRPSLSSAATSPGNYESTVGSSPYNVMSPWNQSSPMNKSPWLTPSPFANFFEGLPRINGLIGSLVREEGHIYSLAVSADLLYTSSDSKNIRVWKNMKEFYGFNSNSGLVKAIVICRNRIFTSLE